MKGVFTDSLAYAESFLVDISELPKKFQSLEDKQKTTIRVIEATLGIFSLIGSFLGFIPFTCAVLGYFTPHLVELTFAKKIQDFKIYYLGCTILCLGLFNMKSTVAYLIAAGLYTIDPITQDDLQNLPSLRNKQEEDNFSLKGFLNYSYKMFFKSE